MRDVENATFFDTEHTFVYDCVISVRSEGRGIMMKKGSVIKVFQDWGNVAAMSVYYLPNDSKIIRSQRFREDSYNQGNFEKLEVEYGRGGCLPHEGLFLGEVELDASNKIVRAYIDLDKIICQNPH